MTFDDRELLWKAWPEGYLAMRGIMTMGGWQCLGVVADCSLWFPKLAEGSTAPVVGLPSGVPPYEQRSAWRPEMSMFRTAADIGELLPMVNPRDPASWGCLVQDLANAAGFVGLEVGFCRRERTSWVLYAVLDVESYRTLEVEILRTFEFPVLDMAEAFVRARIQLREEGS